MSESQEKICCANCRFFDSKTFFCRKNPPVPLIVFKGPQKFVESKFPVIKMPSIDYCSYHEFNEPEVF